MRLGTSGHVSVSLLPLGLHFPVKPHKHPPLRRPWSHPEPGAIQISITPRGPAQAPPFQSLCGPAAAWPTFSSGGQSGSLHLCPTWAIGAYVKTRRLLSQGVTKGLSNTAKALLFSVEAPKCASAKQRISEDGNTVISLDHFLCPCWSWRPARHRQVFLLTTKSAHFQHTGFTTGHTTITQWSLSANN